MKNRKIKRKQLLLKLREVKITETNLLRRKYSLSHEAGLDLMWTATYRQFFAESEVFKTVGIVTWFNDITDVITNMIYGI